MSNGSPLFFDFDFSLPVKNFNSSSDLSAKWLTATEKVKPCRFMELIYLKRNKKCKYLNIFFLINKSNQP